MTDRFQLGVEAAAKFCDDAAAGWSETDGIPSHGKVSFAGLLRADTLRDAARAIRSIPAPEEPKRLLDFSDPDAVDYCACGTWIGGYPAERQAHFATHVVSPPAEQERT